ncbi:MAG TPA: MFS transporter [Baekduia sp.]
MLATSPLPRTRTRTRLADGTAFWMLAATLAFLFFASSVPSPLYVVYQAKWHFSPITLTSVFAVYVAALLLSLVFAGSLSDRVGRRPVLLGALLVQLAAMVLFGLAHGVDALFAARIVQGFATGVATGALSAALIDLQPTGRPHLGALLSAAAPPLGLAAGALGSGLLVEYGPDPLRLVYWLLVAIFAAAIAGVAAMPETVVRDDGPLRTALRPKIGIPQHARATFVAVAPVLVATWALGGLYLSLGPSLAVSLLHTTSHVTGGLVIVAVTATGALTSVLLRDHPPVHVLIGGALMLALGIAVTILGLNEQVTGLFFAGSVLAGVGFGAGFSGGFKTIVSLAPPTERASLVAAVYVLCYIGFAVPAVAAGVAVTHAGLLATTNVYGSILVVLALGAAVATTARHRRGVAAVA